MKRLSFAAALISITASAAYADADGTVTRLTPAEIAAAQSAGQARHRAEESVDADIVGAKRQIHGEVGFGVSSRGGHEVFGTVVAPLGDNGFAAFSFADGSYGHYNPYENFGPYGRRHR